MNEAPRTMVWLIGRQGVSTEGCSEVGVGALGIREDRIPQI